MVNGVGRTALFVYKLQKSLTVLLLIQLRMSFGELGYGNSQEVMRVEGL